MYRMFTGKAPFRDGGVPALIHAHLNVFPKPMTETAPELPGALDRVVLRCLAKKPEQRYESMEELSRALAERDRSRGLGLVSLEYDGGDDDARTAGAAQDRGREACGRATSPKPRRRRRRPDSRRRRVVRRRDGPRSTAPMRAIGAKRSGGPGRRDGNADRTAVMVARGVDREARGPDESHAARELGAARVRDVPDAQPPARAGVQRMRRLARARGSGGGACARDGAAHRAPRRRRRCRRRRRAHIRRLRRAVRHTRRRRDAELQSRRGSAHRDRRCRAPHSAQSMGWGAPPPNTQPPQPPPSAWQRFLSWTGLRGGRYERSSTRRR